MIGQVIDGYQIIDVLGRGGMGVVYKALDVSLEKTVALKALDPVQAQDEQFLGRFKVEARTLGRLQHPHIVNVFAFRHVDPHLFIVMEYVDGGNLADLIAERGPIPWREALPLVRQSVEAMAHAHRLQVVHRDIKPRNILLTSAGRVKVTDFGLAKIQEETADNKGLTRTGFTGGTLYYMPPEQLHGLNRVDHRGDIYSLGMTCYELLAGRVPFNKEVSQYEILQSIDTHSFPSLDETATGVPAPLAQIVMRALAHDPADRFQEMGDMLEALDHWTAQDAAAPRDAAASQTTLAVTRPLPISPLKKAPADDKGRGDSSSLLKSLKALLKTPSGSWRGARRPSRGVGRGRRPGHAGPPGRPGDGGPAPPPAAEESASEKKPEADAKRREPSTVPLPPRTSGTPQTAPAPRAAAAPPPAAPGAPRLGTGALAGPRGRGRRAPRRRGLPPPPFPGRGHPRLRPGLGLRQL